MDNNVGSFTVDEGIDAYGTRKKLIFDGDQIVGKVSYDATEMLKEAAEARAVTSTDRWKEGLGTRIGMIPMPELDRINAKFRSQEERTHAVLCWLRDNPHLVTFDKFLK